MLPMKIITGWMRLGGELGAEAGLVHLVVVGVEPRLDLDVDGRSS